MEGKMIAKRFRASEGWVRRDLFAISTVVQRAHLYEFMDILAGRPMHNYI